MPTIISIGTPTKKIYPAGIGRANQSIVAFHAIFIHIAVSGIAYIIPLIGGKTPCTRSTRRGLILEITLRESETNIIAY